MNFKYSFTPRRFPYVEFRDYYDAECSIQLSSLYELDAIWIGIDNADPRIMAKDANRLGLAHLLKDGPERLNGWVDYPVPAEVHFTTRMHLKREQVKALLPILQHFANTGMFPTQQEVKAMQAGDYLNRNSKEEIKRDINFLREIQGRLSAYKDDVTQGEYVDQMIKDWIGELKKIFKGMVMSRIKGKQNAS